MHFKNNILGLVPETDWLSIPFEPTRPDDPIDGLFDDMKTDNLVAEWQSIAADYGLPMMAQFHAFDVKSQQTIRTPVDSHNVEKGLIKVSLPLSERMRAMLKAGVRDEKLYEWVIKDGARLAEEVITRSKVAKNELLATGQVTIKENNLDLTVNYGVEDEQTEFELDLSADADIMSQLLDIKAAASAKGVTLTGIVTSEANIAKIRKNASVQTAVNGSNASGAYIKTADLYDFLRQELKITQIITNDLIYALPTGEEVNGRPVVESKRYYPENKVTFFGTRNGAKLGTGLWGDPPEKDIGAFTPVENSDVDPYVCITQWVTEDPATVWTKASALFMPVLFDPTSLWIATVAEENAGG